MKKLKVVKRKRPIFSAFKGIVRIFVRKPKIYFLTEKPEKPAVYLANHCRKKGPIVYDMYLPIFTAKWGAGEMLGNFKSRWHYLRDVFYMQKRGFSKTKASFNATFEAIFSPFIYKGLGVIGTFHDARLLNTIDTSIDALSKDTSVLIFPENSDEGYFEILTGLHAGFTLLADKYQREKGEDVPIYPMYFHEKKNTILFGEPVYYSQMKESGLSRKEMAENLRLKINALHDMIENGQFSLN